MKKILTNNLGMKLLSILIAVVGWVVIINYDDPTITKSISGIKVTVDNEKSISSKGKCYEIVSGNTVDIVVKGKKSLVDGLKASNFTARADLAKSSITNAVPVVVSCVDNCDLEIVENKNTTMMISIENYLTKQFVVTANLKGNVEEGYYIGTSDINISPNRITVSGPESLISKITDVKCSVDVTDVNSDFSTISQVSAYASNGMKLVSDKIVFSVNNISVSGKPLIKKSVPLKLVIKGDVEQGYRIIKSSVSEENIEVASLDSAYIKSLKEIEIPIDVTGMTEDYENVVALNDYVENGTRVVSKEKKVEVKVSVKKLDEKIISFTAADIKFGNLPNDIVCNYDNDYELSVVVRGLSQDIENITVADLLPTIDVGVLPLGSQSADISFGEIEGIEVLGNVKLPVSLEEKQIVQIEPEQKEDDSEDDNTASDAKEESDNKEMEK